MAREFSQIKAAALQKFSARPEIERATDGVSASDAVGVSSGKGLNRRCWAEGILEAESSRGKLPGGRAIYAWYKSTCDSTCDVERLIRVVKEHMKVKHSDIGATLLRDVTTVTVYGPQTKDALASRAVCPDTRSVHLVPTEFLKRCHQMWVSTFGRRYRVNSSVRADRGRERATKRAGTFASVAKAVAKSRSGLLEARTDDLSQKTLFLALPCGP